MMHIEKMSADDNKQDAINVNKEERAMDDGLPDEIIIESKGEMKEFGQSYNSNEHSDIGNLAYQIFLEEKLDKLPSGKEIKNYLERMLIPADTANIYDPRIGADGEVKRLQQYKVAITEGLYLTPGDIIALVGDFLGVAEEPICFGKTHEEQEKRFDAAFQKLINTNKSASKIQAVIDHIRYNAEKIEPSTYWRLNFIKQKIQSSAIGSTIQYSYKMAKGNSIRGMWHSPYFKLLLTNFDHFSKEAITAFSAGYRTAVQKAKEAGSEENRDKPERQLILLREAFLRGLFACHFITDYFAGGHIRTPRKELLNYITATKNNKGTTPVDLNDTPDLKNISFHDLALAGLLANTMHDEDGRDGVFVKMKNIDKNVSDKRWQAFGDGNYFRPVNRINACEILNVIVETLSDLVRAYSHNLTLVDNNTSKYVPEPDVEANEKYFKHPLFHVSNNSLWCRDNGFNESIQKHGVIKGCIYSFFKVTIYKGQGSTQELTEDTAEETEKLLQALDNLKPKCNII